MRAIIAALALCALTTFALACTDEGGPSVPDGTPAPTALGTPAVAPEEALQVFVQRRLNQGFVADCADAQRPDDVGKQCATLRGEREGMLAYQLGPTFSEYTRLIILQRVDDTWTIAHQETRDPDLDVPGIPWPLEVGATVIVAGTGDCLTVREEPGLGSTTLDCIDDGAEVTINAGPTDRDGLQWWRLEGYGWSAGLYLRYPEEAPTPTPEP